MLAGVPVHVIQRGNNRGACFVNDEDRNFYLFHLARGLGRFGCQLHAYCLMTNHVHLLLTPEGAESCAPLMKHMGQLHSQYFNKRYKRTGSLWEGRFRSCLVQSERYVLACYRYIELNPVRAGMVPSASAYRWSSHNGNAGRASNQPLTRHAEYLALAADETSRHAAYRGLFAVGDEPAFLAAIRDATNGGFALVGEQLKSVLPADTQRRLERRPPGPRAKTVPQPDNVSGELELKSGLRPRTG